MRKKTKGSKPYKETWYLFGGELKLNDNYGQVIKKILKSQAGISIEVKNPILWDMEIKKDTNNQEKQFIYLDVLCEYKSGILKKKENVKKIEWVSMEKLTQYDIVPPSRKLFKSIGYIK